MLQIKGNQEDFSAMLISAERYALGRKTYIVQWTCEFIKKNIHLLTLKDKAVMIRDIQYCNDYGDSFDKNEWIKLLTELRKEN